MCLAQMVQSRTDEMIRWGMTSWAASLPDKLCLYCQHKLENVLLSVLNDWTSWPTWSVLNSEMVSGHYLTSLKRRDDAMRAWDEADFQLTIDYWERCIGHQHQYINITTMLMNFLINTQSKIHIHETAMIRRNRTMTAQLEVCLTFNIRPVL